MIVWGNRQDYTVGFKMSRNKTGSVSRKAGTLKKYPGVGLKYPEGGHQEQVTHCRDIFLHVTQPERRLREMKKPYYVYK